jgi:hypothetical protein
VPLAGSPSAPVALLPGRPPGQARSGPADSRAGGLGKRAGPGLDCSGCRHATCHHVTCPGASPTRPAPRLVLGRTRKRANGHGEPSLCSPTVTASSPCAAAPVGGSRARAGPDQPQTRGPRRPGPARPPIGPPLPRSRQRELGPVARPGRLRPGRSRSGRSRPGRTRPGRTGPDRAGLVRFLSAGGGAF